MQPLTDPQRNADLAAIHCAKKDLNLADPDYRLLLSERYGVMSAAALKPAERLDLLAEFDRQRQAKGIKPRPGKPGQPKLSKQRWRINKLLEEAGRGEEYGHALAQRICKVDRLEFCRPDALGKIIAALEYDKKRAHAKAGKP